MAGERSGFRGDVPDRDWPRGRPDRAGNALETLTFLEAVARVAVALAATGIAGWAIARFFADGLTGMERTAWSFAAGLLAQCTTLLLIFAARARPDTLKVLLADAVILGASLALRRPRRSTAPTANFERGPSPMRITAAALIVVATAAWTVFLVQALAEPMWATDYLAIWGLKGKTAFLTSALPRRLFEDPALYWAHKEYPLLVPLSFAALASILGSWNDQALALFSPACELGTLLALGGFLSRRVSRISGAGAAVLAALCFPLYRAVNSGTAEAPFALAVTLVACALLDVIERGSRRDLIRLGMASLFCVSTKQEGILFVGLAAGLLWAQSRGPSRLPWRAGAAALLVPAIVHWSLLYVLRGPQTRRDFDLTLFGPQRWRELPPLFAMVVGRMLGTEARQAMVPLLAIAAFLLLTRRGIADPLLPVFAGQMLCYAIAFSVSSFDPIYAIEGAFRRIALTLFPAFTLVLCARGSHGDERSVLPKTASFA